MNLVETNYLTKQYHGIKRVNSVDLMVPQACIYGFLGPNGAGKSTTLKMLLGLVKPTSGSIRLFGKEFHAKNRLSILKSIGSLIESPSYYGHLTGEENLKIMQRLLDVPEKNINEVLHIVRLEKQKDKKVSQYSLGMKQRLGIACALLGFPKLLILDEPTNGLDPAGIQEMRELMLSLPQKHGMTLLVSSHLLSEIDCLASQVGIIADGKLVFQDSMHALHAQSKDSIVLRTQNNPLAQQILLEHGFQSSMEEHALRLDYLSETDIMACNALLVNSHIGVLRIEERKTSLEDIFLSLTEKAVSL